MYQRVFNGYLLWILSFKLPIRIVLTIFKLCFYDLLTVYTLFAIISEEQQKNRNGEFIGMLDFQGGKNKRIAHKGSFGMSVRLSLRNKGIGNILLSGLITWVKNIQKYKRISITPLNLIS